MYSRKTGLLRNGPETQKKIESFNKELREQYRRKSNESSEERQPLREAEINVQPNDFSIDENVIIIGLLLLLLSQENKDLLLIGALAALLLWTH